MTGPDESRDGAQEAAEQLRPYHHPDLPAALIQAGMDLTRRGGPEALSIREATRRAGVSPNAAYRHFADRRALLQAVSTEVQHRVVEQMQDSSHSEASSRNPGAADRLRAVGLGYIEFALAEPGWFAVLFFGAGVDELQPGAQSPQVPLPFAALVDALDGMVGAGLITQAQRAGAEWPCWSTVHGFAELALHGPLRGFDRARIQHLAAQSVDAIIAGLQARP